MIAPVVYPWPAWLAEYLVELWQTQGVTNQRNCSGMSSFSYWGPHRLTYDASDDSIVHAEDWNR